MASNFFSIKRGGEALPLLKPPSGAVLSYFDSDREQKSEKKKTNLAKFRVHYSGM